MSLSLDVSYEVTPNVTFNDLKVTVIAATDFPRETMSDPAIFVYRKVGASCQFANVATAVEMEQYPDDPAHILPKTDQKYFRQSQLVIRKATLPELERVRLEIDQSIRRLVLAWKDEGSVSPSVTVTYA